MDITMFRAYNTLTRSHKANKTKQYVSKLSKRQADILNMLMDGHAVKEIRKRLRISEKEYADELQVMRSYENIKILL